MLPSVRLSDILSVGFVPRLDCPDKFVGVFQSLLTLSPAPEICRRLVQQPEECFGLSEAFSIKLHRHKRQRRGMCTLSGCATGSANLFQHLLQNAQFIFPQNKHEVPIDLNGATTTR